MKEIADVRGQHNFGHEPYTEKLYSVNYSSDLSLLELSTLAVPLETAMRL